MPLMEVVDRRGTWERKSSFAAANARILGAMFRNFLTKLHTSYYPHNTHIFLQPILCKETGKYCYPEEILPWNHPEARENQGLILFIHGWKGLPHNWHEYLIKIKRDRLGFCCLAPHVISEGNCSLEEAAKPLLAIVKDYAVKNPCKPIVLIGTSNGGRIAMHLESQLAVEDLDGRCFSLVSLAGVHYGTKFVDYLTSCNMVWTSQMDSHILEDFSWQSQMATECLGDWREKQLIWRANGIQASHLFCVTTEDGQVYPLSCSLPRPPLEAIDCCNYRVYHGENHLSIVPAACNDVLHWVKQACRRHECSHCISESCNILDL